MRSTITRILKVNHGGEHGAIRIYSAQIIAARLRCPGLVDELAELLSHAQRHERQFL
jgi:ubiquinone biosynthesis monooxygenase Coq7